MATKKTNEQYLKELIDELSRTGDLDNYDLSEVQYETAKVKVKITCKKHGSWLAAPFHLLNGRRCPECKLDTLSNAFKADFEEVKKHAIEIHGDMFDYSKFEYVNSRIKGEIICTECVPPRSFMMSMEKHIHRGQGCSVCNSKQRSKDFLIEGKESFLELIKATPKYDNYLYDRVLYKNRVTNIIVTCKKHGDFTVTPYNHLYLKCGCPFCGNKVSSAELEIRDFVVKEITENMQCNIPLLQGKHIDIYLPDLNLGIEYCGLYFHSIKFKTIDYHFDKYLSAKKLGITLIQIFEDEWIFDKDKVKLTLLIAARKTTPDINNLSASFYSEVVSSSDIITIDNRWGYLNLLKGVYSFANFKPEPWVIDSNRRYDPIRDINHYPSHKVIYDAGYTVLTKEKA